MTRDQYISAIADLNEGCQVVAEVRCGIMTRLMRGKFQPDKRTPLLLRVRQKREFTAVPYRRVISVREVK